MPADAPRCACPALCACREPVDAPGALCAPCAEGWHVLPSPAALVRDLEAAPPGELVELVERADRAGWDR